MKPHHFYRTSSSSATGILLRDLITKCDEVSETARQWALSHGATSYIESFDGIAGGISAIEINNCIVKHGFDRVKSSTGEYYFLPQPDTDLEREMYSLPIVSEVEFINILRFKPRFSKSGSPMPYTFGDQTPVLFLCDDYWYVDMPYECTAPDLSVVSPRDFYLRQMSVANAL